ncbi:hypothetical protein HAX54_025668 [Datura stramonium]|uniref:Uncharacterized protein n=1 Tax=Datura stramonium TaxID=4076 RepID=A0ABS8V053_DATST|nr:hypothetical protein [Datura stramonium]
MPLVGLGEVDALREEIDRRKSMVLPMIIDLNLLVVASDSPVMERSPPDDLCVRISPIGGATTEKIQEEEQPHDKEVVSPYSPLKLQSDP